MAGRQLPGLGLTGDWNLGEDDWKDENDVNLLKLSVLTQGSFSDKVAAEPGAPAEGDIVLLDETHATHPNEIAVYDEGAWAYILPRDGMLLWNETAEYYEKYSATDGAWAELQTGGGGGGVTTPVGLKMAKAYRNGAWTSGAANGWRAYPMDTVSVDPGGWWDPTYGGFKPPAGTYLVSSRIRCNAVSFLTGGLFINGAVSFAMGNDPDTANRVIAVGASVLVTVDGTQTISVGAFNGATANVAGTTGIFDTYLEVVAVSGTAVLPTYAFKGALLKRLANQTVDAQTAAHTFAWDAETYDVGGWHDNAVNNTRLTVPAGVTKIRLVAGGQLTNVVANSDVLLNFRKNGVAFDGYMGQTLDTSVIDPRFNLSSPVIDVVPGDYFELRLSISGDASVDIKALETWFAVEAVEQTATVTVPVNQSRGCLANRTATQAVVSGAATTAQFTNEIYDNGGWHDTAVNNDRFVVPAGVTKVRCWARLECASSGPVLVYIDKNGAIAPGCPMHNKPDTTGTDYISISSGVIDVVPGDYFRLALNITGTVVDKVEFGIEAVEYATGSAAVDSTAGVAFPGTPAVGQRYFRTDRGIEYYYDGTRWLSMQLFRQEHYVAEGNVTTLGATGRYAVPGKSQGYGVYVIDFFATLLLNATPASWNVNVAYADATNATTIFGTVNVTTPTDVPINNWVHKTQAINAVLNAAAVQINFSITENSGAAGLYSGAGYTYRLIG